MVCDALASGRQSVILRKGGIHEGRGGFSFAHDSFFLFPTRFHTTAEQVREGEVVAMPEWQPGDTIRITHHAEAVRAVTLTDWEQIADLRRFHIYSDATVKDRFDWEGKGMASGSIHVALVRVSRLAEPWEFPYTPKFGGCRSWITLPEPPEGWRENALPVAGQTGFEELESLLPDATQA